MASLCVGEITSLTNDYPPFVKNIFDTSDMLPLLNDGCGTYYTERNFSVLYEEDLSSSLQSFYEHTAQELDDTIYKLNEKEKSYYKKLLKKISHESNAYLKLGADRYIGFKMLILRKNICLSFRIPIFIGINSSGNPFRYKYLDSHLRWE